MNPGDKGNCHKCRKLLTFLDYGRHDTCSGCRSDTRVCLNCIHHDVAYNNQCKENQADRVVEKNRSNFCDYFSPKTHGELGEDPKEALRKAAEALFNKKS